MFTDRHKDVEINKKKVKDKSCCFLWVIHSFSRLEKCKQTFLHTINKNKYIQMNTLSIRDVCVRIIMYND